MALDGIFLNLLCSQLKDKLISGKLEKVYMPTRYELVFSIRTRAGGYKFLLSASGASPRLHLTAQAPENPPNPPMLCMLFRKQLAGGTLIDIEQIGFDRIVKLKFEATNEIGDRVKRTVVIEIMAQYSNIILLDENERIIDSIKKVDASKSSVRQILPGLMYEMPPSQDKFRITESNTDEIINKILSFKDKKLSSAVLSAVEGVSPTLAKEIAYRSGGDLNISEVTQKTVDKLKFELSALKSIVINKSASPTAVLTDEGKYTEFSFIPLSMYSDGYEFKSFSDLSELLDNFYFERERFARTKSKADDLFKTVNNLIERTSKKISNQKIELEECADRDTKRIYAELINANLYRLTKGGYEYEVENYYDDNKPIKIPVRPDLSPSANAQRYFKEYRKSQIAEKKLTEFIASGEEDLEYLLTVRDELNRADTEREITEIRLELSEGGYIKRKVGTKNKKASPMPPMRIEAPDGFYILVGRNNIQNDKLSLKTAAKTDMWFHIQKAPGSHVVLVCDGREPTDKAMEFAAGAAAYYSSGREAGSVVIDYTPVKNLKKPNGAKPGFVVYYTYQSTVIKPRNPQG